MVNLTSKIHFLGQIYHGSFRNLGVAECGSLEVNLLELRPLLEFLQAICVELHLLL